jgi:beta-lactamase class A
MKWFQWITDGKLAIGLVALSFGVGLGAYAVPFFHHQAILNDVRDFSNSYHFINPLLACGQDENLGKDESDSLQSAIQNVIKAHTNAGDITDASVYFSDLNNGPWMGVNSREAFTPGSLLKLPLAMSVYKLAENDPTLLAKKLVYTGQEVSEAQFFEPAPLAAGTYPVSEMVRQMLINSNNNAANVLANAVGADAFKATYAHLGIAQPSASNADYTLTTITYASFFRILYSATYLDDEHSEQLLKYLSESTFTQGLVAGVPSGVVVAHKFGERAFSNSMDVQLHDCGIVYVPNHPYVICVMTRGTDFNKLAETIADISRTAYTSTQP